MAPRKKEKLTAAEREERIIEQDYYGPEESTAYVTKSTLRTGIAGIRRTKQAITSSMTKVWNGIYTAIIIFSIICVVTTFVIGFDPKTKISNKKVLKGLFVAQCVTVLVSLLALIRALWWASGVYVDAVERWRLFMIRVNAFFAFIISSITSVVIVLVAIGLRNEYNFFMNS